jgi:hypothetical protein
VKQIMFMKALTGLFLVTSTSCLALCVYMRMQRKRGTPQKVETDQPIYDEPVADK